MYLDTFTLMPIEAHNFGVQQKYFDLALKGPCDAFLTQKTIPTCSQDTCENGSHTLLYCMQKRMYSYASKTVTAVINTA